VRGAISDSKVDVGEREETIDEASKVVDTNSPAYAEIAGVVRQTFGVPVAPEIMTGATDSRHYLPIADAARVHGTNERLAVADLAPAISFYTRLIQETR